MELNLKNDLSELHRLSAAAEAFARANGMDETETYNLLLVLEEVITNIISYGYTDEAVHGITVTITLENRELTLRITDDAREFNPLEKAMPDLNAPLDERPIGGLGIALFRSIMDSIEYRRVNDRNILTLKRTLAS
jgi:anti-sigma regulatory factor (Ser/Thr protein kinase)